MLLVSAAAAAIAGTGLVAAQSLFQGDSCNFNIDSFTGANAGLVTCISSIAGAVSYSGGSMIMTLEPPSGSSNVGISVIGTTTLSLLYGTVEATIEQGNIGGVVTYLTLINQTSLDEVDYEWIGDESTSVWTNFFYRGRRERDPTTLNEIWSKQISMAENTMQSHDYKIEWTPDHISWYIDGSLVRTQNKNDTFESAGTGDGLPYDHYHYPDTPLTVNVGIWNDQDPVWSNGPVNWANYPNGVTAKVSSLKVSCYTGNIPTFTDPVVVTTATAVLETRFQQSYTTSPTSSATGTATVLTGLPAKTNDATSKTLSITLLITYVLFSFLPLMRPLTILVALAACGAHAQSLFQGDSCNLNIPNFNSANSAFGTGGHVTYSDGQMIVTVMPPSSGVPTDDGIGAIATTSLSLLYGTVEATIQQSTVGGVVTYLTLINDDTKDEIDYEWIGNERTSVWTNFFFEGIKRLCVKLGIT
ncbi:hypothetical protein HDU83_004119 [Entophlyctis luteolus]|nr:hypothetical protein HDU83_004119 [Entophlyctis luteolus]